MVTPELLDSDAATPAEIQHTLADLRRINRWFGGVRTTRRLLEKVITGWPAPVARDSRATGWGGSAEKPELTLLDVGAGSGDVPLGASRQLPLQPQISVTLLDRMPAHLPRNGLRAVAADALALPFRDASFDLVTCSLFVHHLEPAQIVRFTNEALRVARVAVLLNDLRRAPLHLALIYAGFPLFNRVSLHDGIASVRRSYTPRELKAILRETGAASIEIETYFLYRMGILLWKQAGACPPTTSR